MPKKDYDRNIIILSVAPFHLRKNGAGRRVSVTGKNGSHERRDVTKTTDIPTTGLALAVGAGGAATPRPRGVDGRNERTRSFEKGSRTMRSRRGCARKTRSFVPEEERCKLTCTAQRNF